MNETYIYNDDVKNVLNNISDESIDLVVTDPPYKISQGGCSADKPKNTSGIFNKQSGSNIDSIRKGDLFRHNSIKFSDWIPEVYRVLKQQTHAYFIVNDRNLNDLINVAISSGFVLQNILVWKKNNVTPNRYYMKNCEFIVMCRKGKAKSIENKGTKSVLEVNNIIGSKSHPTEKPSELLEILIANSSKKGDVVLDPFMGSGSTLVAAKNLDRSSVGIEIDEQYFEVAKKRLNIVDDELMQAA